MEISAYEPGSFCWPELATSDQEGGKKFYTSLFGWSVNEIPIQPGETYTMLQLGGKDVGALYRMRPDQSAQGVPPHWMSYVSVASADQAARRAKELGGKVLAEPFDVFDVGRMAVLQDPQGARFSLWQAKKHIGARVINEPGALCWNELDTTDTAGAAKFYTALFGWITKVGGDYTEFHRGKTPAGGMMRIPKEWGKVPPNWLVYFAVEDCDASAAKAKELRGAAMVPPTDIANVGRFAVLRDPQGAVFAIIRLNAAA